MAAASDSRRRLIVGTAGHVDHGKTSLLKALTGIDCDRWQEEKERGITIDLGFAHIERGEFQIGFVDVPGHERFVDNALAGLGGIRIMLLVVAADEGVKPQTREHLEICSLLDIPAGLVALTKVDLVSDDLTDLARIEVEEVLAGTPFESAKVVPVSTVDGTGLAELESQLLELADLTAPSTSDHPIRPARLPIDRSFVLPGLGVVVTGSLTAGRIAVGDTLETVPGRHPVRVRSVQVHSEDRSEALVGERTALRLAGAGLEVLPRGTQLVEPGSYLETQRMIARLSLSENAPKNIEGWLPVRFHLYSAERPGRVRPLDGTIEPSETGLVEVRLSEPVVAAPGDRWICRRLSPATPLGGGDVLDPGWHPLRPAERRDAATRLIGPWEKQLELWISQSALGGCTTGQLARRSGRSIAEVADAVSGLVSESRALKLTGQHEAARWIAPKSFETLERRARDLLAEYFAEHRLADGMPKAEMLAKLLPSRARPFGDTYLSWLNKRKVAAVRGKLVNLPGRSAELSTEESGLSQKILTLFVKGGLEAPSPSDLREATRAKPQVIEGIVNFLVQQGQLLRLPDQLVISAGAIAKVREDLQNSGLASFSVPEFKARFGLSRKWAIPILEHLDSVGVTRRVGNIRQLTAQKQDAID